MSDDRQHRDDFTRQEREALEAWEVPAAPHDLAEKVLARAGGSVSPRRHWFRVRWVALAASLLLAVGLTWLLLPRSDASGRLLASGRTTVAIDDRAVVVAEDGTRLSWQSQAGGGLAVEQESGNAFFRVDRGGVPFVVKTPAGSVEVKGTCFRTEVIEMKASRAGLVGAGAGAAAAALVLVTVYEGKVITASSRGDRQVVEAGEVARIAPGRAPEILAGEEQGTSGGEATRADTSIAPSTARGLVRQNLKLRAENEKLQADLEVLQTQLGSANGDARKGKILNLSKQELLDLARRCELRWDRPPLGSTPPKTQAKAARELGLSKEDRATIDRVYERYHRRMTDAIRTIYIEVTGNTKVADSLSPEAMESEIVDKSQKIELKRMHRKLARERAGLQAPPADHSTGSPVERLYRLLTSAGDQVERDIAAALGPDLARRYREHRGGFGSRSRSSHGCPDSR
jgi:hypothetical protein